MKNNTSKISCKRGFTLIELLVVVLIIGILAAVAVPQYQKAVEKSRATQALTLLKSVAQAYEGHHLATGEWASSFDELDVDIPWTGNESFFNGATDSVSNGEWALSIEHNNPYMNLNIGRLTGKYKGAGFMVVFATNSTRPLQQILCVERIAAAAVSFDNSLPAGAYCVGLFRGQHNSTSSSGRYYTLP